MPLTQVASQIKGIIISAGHMKFDKTGQKIGELQKWNQVSGYGEMYSHKPALHPQA